MEGGEMSLEWKGDGEEFCRFDMVVRGKGRFEVHELEPYVCHHFPRPESGHQKYAKPPVLMRMKNNRNSYLLFGFMGMTPSRIDSISHKFTRGVIHWASVANTLSAKYW